MVRAVTAAELGRDYDAAEPPLLRKEAATPPHAQPMIDHAIYNSCAFGERLDVILLYPALFPAP